MEIEGVLAATYMGRMLRDIEDRFKRSEITSTDIKYLLQVANNFSQDIEYQLKRSEINGAYIKGLEDRIKRLERK